MASSLRDICNRQGELNSFSGSLATLATSIADTIITEIPIFLGDANILNPSQGDGRDLRKNSTSAAWPQNPPLRY
jgi:hypothetical protein